jgi:hypothetical protein
MANVNRVPTKEELRQLEQHAKDRGNLICGLCGKPTGIYKLSLKKLPEGDYVCNYCRPDLFERR